MRSFRLGSGRRGAVLSAVTGTIWYGFWSLIAVTAFRFTADAADLAALRVNLPIGFLLVWMYWQLAPMVSASLGASLDLKKLLVYPICRDSLFLVEVLLRLANAVEMLMVSIGGLGGLIWNPLLGGWRVVFRVVGCFVLFTLFNLLLSAGIRNLLERLLSRRRLREAVVLLLVLLATLRGCWWG